MKLKIVGPTELDDSTQDSMADTASYYVRHARLYSSSRVILGFFVFHNSILNSGHSLERTQIFASKYCEKMWYSLSPKDTSNKNIIFLAEGVCLFFIANTVVSLV